MPEITLTSVLFIVNLLTSAADVIIAFSLFVYIAARNPYHPVARGFVALMLFVAVVYAGDVLLARVRDAQTAVLWLRFQWIGIALVPAAYLHFSDALLRTTRLFSPWRRIATYAAYGIGIAFFVLAINTDLIVRGDIFFPFAPQFAAGQYFWVFGLYFVVTFGWGLWNTLWARYRCLTPTSRRRMTYLLLSFAAPALGVFPYLLLAGSAQFVTADGVLILSLIGNAGVGSMMVLMAYAVSYYGALEPDRVVKRNLIKYLIQGPLMGTAAIGLILVVPRVEALFGLPQDSLVIFAAIISIVLFQIIVSLAKPILDVVSDWEDRREVAWLQRLDERLLTHSDQAQLFENILAALCDLLRARQGFVLALAGGQLKLESFVGSRAAVLASIHDDDIRQVLTSRAGDFVVRNGIWLRPLYSRSGEVTLGVLGIASDQPLEELDSREREAIARPTEQAERSLEDRQLQTVIFGALQELRPEIESLQRYRSLTPYPGSTQTAADVESKAASAEFPQWVRDALRDFWGGPKFSESPLLDLLVVREALKQHEQSPTKALRSVLLEAIELLRPAGEPDLHAREWVLYNILHMKFIEGKRIRDIADRLAMSESDLYRKQRLAIDEVARTLAVMEHKVSSNGTNGSSGTSGTGANGVSGAGGTSVNSISGTSPNGISGTSGTSANSISSAGANGVSGASTNGVSANGISGSSTNGVNGASTNGLSANDISGSSMNGLSGTSANRISGTRPGGLPASSSATPPNSSPPDASSSTTASNSRPLATPSSTTAPDSLASIASSGTTAPDSRPTTASSGTTASDSRPPAASTSTDVAPDTGIVSPASEKQDLPPI